MANCTYREVKFILIPLYILTGLVGLVSTLLIFKVHRHFEEFCFLYAKLQVMLDDGDVIVIYRDMSVNDGDVSVDDGDASVDDDSYWGEEDLCRFAIFEGVAVFMSSFVWVWIYVYMNVVRHSTPHNANFILPRLVTNCLLCIDSVIRSYFITSGYGAFCDNISICEDTEEGEPGQCVLSLGSCKTLQNRIWYVYEEQETDTALRYDDFMTAVIALSWMEVVALALIVTAEIAEACLLAGHKVKRSSVLTSLEYTNLSFEPEVTRFSNTGLSERGNSAVSETSPPAARKREGGDAELTDLARWSGNSQPSEQDGQKLLGPDDVIVHFQPEETEEPTSASDTAPLVRYFPTEEEEGTHRRGKQYKTVSNV